MVDRRKKDANWLISFEDDQNSSRTIQDAMLAVLMDLRDELKEIKALLGCHNCRDIPRILRQIRGNTSRIPKKARKKQ